MQNSDIEGQRHLNDCSRAEHVGKKKAAALQKKLLLNLPPDHPLRRAAEERERD